MGLMDLRSFQDHFGIYYRTALLLTADEARARELLIRALLGQPKAASRQTKRRDYVPRSDQGRRRPLKDPAVQLQLQIFAEAEILERATEKSHPRSLGTSELLLRYMKLIVYSTLLRTSFWVSVGIGRLLHAYSTDQVLELQAFLSPEATKDDASVRRVKRALFDILLERFRSFLTETRGPRGERLFVPDSDPERWLDFVQTCLELFVPVGTACVLPGDIDRFQTLPELHGKDDGSAFAKHELARMHSVIHPSCFERLTAAVCLESPCRCLAVPHILVNPEPPSSRGSDPMNRLERLKSATLSQQEIAELWDDARRMLKRRSRTHLRCLRLWVDGEERGEWDLHTEPEAHLEIGPGTRAAAISTTLDGRDLPLLTQLIFRNEDGTATEDLTEIAVPGHVISFRTIPNTGNVATAHIEIRCRETRWSTGVRHGWRRFRPRTAAESASHRPGVSGWLAAACAALAVVFASFWWWNYGELQRSEFERMILTRQLENLRSVQFEDTRSLPADLAAPSGAVEILELSGALSRSSSPVLRLAAGVNSVVILINESYRSWIDYDEFILSIRSLDGDQSEVRQIQNLHISANGFLAVVVPSSDLATGVYCFELVGVNERREVFLQKYIVEVRREILP